MTRAKADKEYRTFVRGLITEASGLTYPEGSVRGLDNIDINVNGSARRRLGIAEEDGGKVVGGGLLTDTLFTNNTGGPLSLAPSVFDSVVTKTYDGSTDPDGDWTLGGGASVLSPGVFKLDAQRDTDERIAQDVSLTDYDVIELAFAANETTVNESELVVLIGANSSGAGQGFIVDQDGLRPVTTGGHVTSYVRGDYLLDFNGDDSHNYSVKLTKRGVSYVGRVTVREGLVVGEGEVIGRADLEIGLSGDNFEFVAYSDQHHGSDTEISDIAFTLKIIGVNSDLPDETVNDEGFAISTHTWSAPNGDGTKTIQVFQIGNTLVFRDSEKETVSTMGGSVPRRSRKLAFDGYGTGLLYNVSSSQAAQVKLQSANGYGRIWFTSRAVVPFFAELSEDGETIELKPAGYRPQSAGIESVTGQRMIRDLIGVDDGLENDETPTSLSKAHLYNLLNQGWPSDKINDYFGDQANYPSNAQQWFLGKTSDDAFDPALLVEQDFGTSVAAKGRFLLDALLGERDGQAHAVAGVDSPIDFHDRQDVKASTGWEAVAFYAGRLWLAGEVNPKRPSGVYASKTLEGTDDSGKFHQVSDPSAEHFNDLLATDGVFIPIPEAGNIRKLVPFGAGILVMADTGIWMIYGRDTGFKANNFAVEKLTSTGTVSPGTVVRTDQAVYFWADNSIHRIAQAEGGGAYLPGVQDIGQETIFSYYQLIHRDSRKVASSAYDAVSKKIFWFWFSDGINAAQWQSLYDRALILDERTGAFTTYSWEVSLGSPLFGIAGAFTKRAPGSPSAVEAVYDSTDENVLDSNDAIVTASEEGEALTANDLSTSLKLVIVDGEREGLRIGEFSSLTFTDFNAFDAVDPSNYVSYIETADETLGDLQRNKQATFLHSFFTRTETGFLPSLLPKRPSGCTVRAKWDWTNTVSANRWSEAQSAYRYKKPYAPANSSDTFDTGEEILYTKLKVRGKGRAVRFRYESVTGKDFRLLGFSVPYTANAV